MEEIKCLLKNARDLIEQRGFEDAIKILKTVLKKDKNNYMALVLLGVALQDAEQALLAYRKAIALNDKKPLAWQGLASYYERNGNSNEELIQAYIYLCSCENDLQKYQDICTKIYEVCKKLDVFQHCSLLYDYITTLESSEKKDICCKTLNKIVSNISLPENHDTTQLLEKIFALNTNSSSQEDNFTEKYFTYFIKMKDLDYIFNNYDSYIIANATSKLCSFFLKTHIIHYINHNMFCSGIRKQNNVIDKILESSTDSYYCTLVEALTMFEHCEYYDAYSKITSVAPNQNDILVYNIIVGNICLKLKRWLEAEKYSTTPINHSTLIFKRRLLKIKFISLSYQRDVAKSKKSLDLMNDFQNDMDTDELKALFMIYINLNDVINAEKSLSNLCDDSEYAVLKSMFLKKIDKEDESFAILNESKESTPACWLDLGIYYMNLKEYDNALVPLLKAAKHNKHDYSIFIHLGDYYTLCENNLERAKKCYLKSFSLNPECDRAGKCLSNTYRNLQNWEANYEFLKQLSSSETNQNTWTWLELGLHHFALEQWDAAILNLRTYVRFQPNDIEAWESLADAYYSRGSFTSALKCYERSIQINPHRKYSVVQIGAVQCLLSDYTEALKTFSSIDDGVFLPTLKGLSDVYIAIAIDKLSQKLFASCRENAQKAINYICKAILSGHKFVCLWTNLSKAMLIIAKLPPKLRWILINSKFCNDQEMEKKMIISHEALFDTIIKCLCRAIGFSSSNHCALYYELANVYFDYYKSYGNISRVQKSYNAIRNCIKIKQDNWQYWNLLGVVCMCKDIKKYSVAQHAFLKALKLEFCNAMVWSNLGVLQLFFGHIVLANKAFQKAQQFDPLYMQSWIGQALIAESIDHSDAMGLFLHASQLGFHRENSIGYAESVCNNLKSKEILALSKLEYSMKNMHAIPNASDLMAWLIEYDETNPYYLNILGILQEKMGLVKSALESYEKALPHIQTENQDIFLSNYARALYISGKYEESMKVYKSIKTEHISNYCGLALCHNQLGNYQEAYNVYGTAFQWLANDDCEKAQLLIALSCMAYKSDNIEDSTTLFYQCIEQDTSSIFVILAGYALSVLTSNASLQQVVMGNLHKTNLKHEYSHYVSLFQSYSLLKSKDTLSAIRKLQCFLHIFPSDSNLWRLLSIYCSGSSCDFPLIASISAQKAVSLGCSKSNLISNYKMISIAEACLGDKVKALKFAQKALHLHPDKGENWIIFVFACISNKGSSGNTGKQKVGAIINFIKSHLVLSKSLYNWIDFIDRHLHTLL